jgi:GT2 family glycosyltransferase
MSSSRPYKVYAIIVTYNGSAWIDKCLTSLHHSSYPVDCIVIDNDSTDNSVQIISKNFPEVLLIRSQTNLGFGKANNIGIVKALAGGADYVFLLNQDAWVDEDTISCLLEAATLQPEFGVISPLHYDGSGNNLDLGFSQYLSRQYSVVEINNFKNKKDFVVHECEFINAAAWLVSKRCLEIVGGFGYIFYHYGEDSDYTQRMKWLDIKLGFVTNARIYHDRQFRLSDNAVSYKKKLRYYIVRCTAQCADMNSSFGNRFISSLSWVAREQTMYFFKGRNYFAPVLFLHVLGKVFSSAFSILKYRKHLRKKFKFNFLAINS